MGTPTQPESLTLLLRSARHGNAASAELVYRLAFARFRRIAAALLSRHRSHLTLQPTALVSELYLKLRGLRTPIENSSHLFHLAARAMNQVLLARGRTRTPRAASNTPFVPERMLSAVVPPDDASACALRQSLERLERIDAPSAGILRLRFLEGYTWDEIAAKTGRDVWRVREDSEFALEWMRDRMS